MNKILITMFVAMTVIPSLTACSGTVATNTNPVANTKVENTTSQPKPTESAKIDSNVAAKESVKPDKSACLTAKIDGKKLIADQTFVFDYEPFTKSCFVTFANKEDMLDDKDVPRGSTFYIFKDGKQVYKFDDAFDGQPACWVEGVGFEDLNDDKKTDVIIAGKCLATKDSYSVNAVYANANDKFKTNNTANQELENFKTIKQISDFVKKDSSKFFAAK